MEERALRDLAVEREAELHRHSIAVRFGTGSVPGCARQTGRVRVFGSSPQTFSQRQNIFVRVFS